MLFGFLFIELALFFLVPFLVLLCIWADSEWWAAAVVVGAVVAYVIHIGPDVALALAKNPITIGAVFKWAAIYVGIGLIFSIVKWKFKTMKVATAFSEYLNHLDWTKEKLIDIFINYDARDQRAFYEAHEISEEVQRDLLAPIDVDNRKIGRQRATSKLHDLIDTTFVRQWMITRIWNGGDDAYRVPSVNNAGALLTVVCTSSGFKTKYNKFNLTRAVTSWTVYWPFHGLLLVLDDFIRKIIEWFVERFGKMFQRLADGSFADVK